MWRRESPHVLAALLRRHGDYADCEDAAQEALARREAHWRGLFERLREGLVTAELVRDAAGRVTDWRYLEVNPAWGRQVGIPAAQAVGRTVRALFPGIEDVWIDEVAAVVARQVT